MARLTRRTAIRNSPWRRYKKMPAARCALRPQRHGRERIASEARPAATSELWQQQLTDAGFDTPTAHSRVCRDRAANAEEEALACRKLREARTSLKQRGAGNARSRARPLKR
jgi:hypothetical protein